jgi:hypothetical protein
MKRATPSPSRSAYDTAEQSGDPSPLRRAARREAGAGAREPQPTVGRSRPRDSQVTSSAVPTMPRHFPADVADENAEA